MPKNYTKLERPSGPSIDTDISIPEKAALSNVSTPRPSSFDSSPHLSAMSTPRSDKQGDPFNTDIEAMMPSQTKESSTLKINPSKSDCQVWPGKNDWKKKANAAKVKRKRCTCMAQMRRRNRIIVKVLIALLIIGIAFGVGFGISRPLGAPIWGDRDHDN